MTCCVGDESLLIGNDMTVLLSLTNAADPTTPVTDATAQWDVTDDIGPQTGVLTWDALYEYDGITGWYVGALPSTLQLTEWTDYDVVITASGGNLAGDYKATVRRSATVRR